MIAPQQQPEASPAVASHATVKSAIDMSQPHIKAEKGRLGGASLRRSKMLEAQQRAKAEEERKKGKLRRRLRMRKGLKSVGGALQKVNLYKLIGEMERDQELADQLEEINVEYEEERKRKEICREAEAACLRAVKDHLESFLEETPAATYEEWIEELHPENVSDEGVVDHRYYVEESDHRMLWNEKVGGEGRNQVPARSLTQFARGL